MKNNINILVNKFEINDWFEKVVDKLEKIENLDPEQLSIVIVDDKKIKDLNKKYRGKDKVTNVLTFAQCDVKDKYKLLNSSYLGEIFINFQRVQKQSDNIEDIRKGMVNLLIHGYLHSKGYTHNNTKETEIMDRLSRELITRIGSM